MKKDKIVVKILNKLGFSNPSQYLTPKKLSKEEILAAIRQDIIAELDAINLYTAHLEAIDNVDVKKVLEHIIKDEKEHMVELEKILFMLDPEQEQMNIAILGHPQN